MDSKPPAKSSKSRRNTTNSEGSDGSDHLPPIRIAALEMMLSGTSITATAREIGVDRGTIHSWLKNDWVFRSTYDRCRKELTDAARNRLLSMADAAANTVRAAIAAGDAQVALKVLDGIGAMTPPPEPLPSSADGLEPVEFIMKRLGIDPR
jgi:hypothetical protein